MLQPTPENVRRVVDTVTTRDGMSQAELADLLGVSLGGLKKNMITGPSHRPMSGSTWQLLLLLAGRHPRYRLVKRSAGKQKA